MLFVLTEQILVLLIYNKKMGKRFAWFILFIYMIVLTKVVLFKKQLGSVNYADEQKNLSLRQNLHRANLTPFKTIGSFMHEKMDAFVIQNIAGNIVAFVPLGILLPVLITAKPTLTKITAIGLSISLAFEVIQLITGLGIFDVDDLILNTFGTIVGFCCYKLFLTFFR